VETYSLDVPGSAQDLRLHLVARATIAQRTSSTGQQTTEQQVEQPNPGDPRSGLRVTVLSVDTVRPGPSGAQTTRGRKSQPEAQRAVYGNRGGFVGSTEKNC
jgi:hypothetical protein